MSAIFPHKQAVKTAVLEACGVDPGRVSADWSIEIKPDETVILRCEHFLTAEQFDQAMRILSVDAKMLDGYEVAAVMRERMLDEREGLG